jgi:hypothetical protein
MKPTNNTIIYNDIHISSAVKSKCKAVFTLRTIVRKKQKNNMKTRFISPNTTYLFLLYISFNFFLYLRINLPYKNSLQNAFQIL